MKTGFMVWFSGIKGLYKVSAMSTIYIIEPHTSIEFKTQEKICAVQWYNGCLAEAQTFVHYMAYITVYPLN